MGQGRQEQGKRTRREGGGQDAKVLSGEEKKRRRRKKHERGDKRNGWHEYIKKEGKKEERMRGRD